jgi:restriction system protein
MAIPDYQQVMLPLLQLLANDREHGLPDYVDAMADHFKLTSNERQEMLPSGRQTTVRSRVGWAATYLSKAGLIERSGRGRIRITQAGKQVLSANPPNIDNAYLEQFPAFIAFRAIRPQREATPKAALRSETGSTTPPPVGQSLSDTMSPEEMLEKSYQQVRDDLAQQLLSRIKAAPPVFFERVVVDLLVAMGYGGSRADAGQAIGKSGDGGIDGIIKEDRLGLDFVYLQAKRWEGPVSRPIVQGFAGSLEGQRARKGVLITTSRFTREAEEYVQRIEKRIVLIDGEQLAQYMLDFGIGVTAVATYTLQRMDLDYFGEE